MGHDYDDHAGDQTAIDIAVRAHVLKMCPHHTEPYGGEIDLLPAFKLAASEYRQGMHKEFRSQKELTDCIQRVVADHPLDECPLCDRWN